MGMAAYPLPPAVAILSKPLRRLRATIVTAVQQQVLNMMSVCLYP
jgi:hypothetical protein